MRGRKPKPTHLKLVQGNAGRRPLNKREPKPAPGCKKPAFVRGLIADIWDQYAPELERIGVLTSVDGHMFAAWCALAAEFAENPAMMTASRISQMRGLASSFGLDASARARLSVAKDEKPTDDPAERYFAN